MQYDTLHATGGTMDTYMDLTFGWDTLSGSSITEVDSISDVFVKYIKFDVYI